MFIIIILSVLTFILGFVFSLQMVAVKAKKSQDAIFETFGEEEVAARVSRYSTAVAIAAECWSDPRTCDVEMDTRLGRVFAEKIAKYIDALQWCSGSTDFQPEGIASVGFEKICRPLMRS